MKVARKPGRRASSRIKKPRDAALAPTMAVRERILNAALRQVRHGGPLGATARSICQEARITAPTLYHYFGDLGGLYGEVLARIFQIRDEEHPNEYADPEAVIDYVWYSMLRSAENESGVIDLFNQLLASGRIPELMKTSYKRLETAFELVSRKRPLSVEPRLAAEVFWAAALGMATLIAATRHGVPYPAGAAGVLRKAILDRIFQQPVKAKVKSNISAK